MKPGKSKEPIMKRFVAVCVFLFAIASVAPTPAEIMPDQTAHQVTDQIIGLIKANRDAYAADYQKLYAMVDQHILPNFDFRKMAQQVLGPVWRQATEEQRTRFTKEFRELLVRTYATALLKYTNETIDYLPLKIVPGDRIATVKSIVHRGGGAPTISINYSFYLADAGWKVYDMAIEGPS